MSLVDLKRRVEKVRRKQNRPPLSQFIPSFPAFCNTYLSHRLTNPSSELHDWLDNAVDDMRHKRGQKLCVIAPRGSAKTTRGTICHVLYAVAAQSEEYILIISDTVSQARDLLGNVRHEAENNELLRKHFPGVSPGPVWRDTELQFRNGVIVGALGTGGKIRGRIRQVRPSLLIVDDPQNMDHVTSEVKRARSGRWFAQDVEYAGSPRTNYLVIGTALHRECIVCQLQKTPGWKSVLFRGIEKWPERMDLWQEWESLMCSHDDPEHEAKAKRFFDDNPAMLEGHKVLWPSRFTLYDLMLKRLSSGQAAFEFEQQGNPVDPSLCEWPAEYFDHANFWFDTWPDRLQVKTIAIDPSKGTGDDSGDYQAYVVFGRDHNGVEYVEADLRRQDVEAMAHTGCDLIKQHKPDGMGVEEDTLLGLLSPVFLRLFKEQRIECSLYSVKHKGASKEVRIRRLTSSLSMRRMRFKRRSAGTQLLVQQLKDFPHGAHDDAGDSLEMARRLAIDLVNEGKVKR